MSAGGGCEAAVTARKRIGLSFGIVVSCRRFPLELHWADYESYVRPAMLYGREAWCPKEKKKNPKERNRDGNFIYG